MEKYCKFLICYYQGRDNKNFEKKNLCKICNNFIKIYTYSAKEQYVYLYVNIFLKYIFIPIQIILYYNILSTPY